MAIFRVRELSAPGQVFDVYSVTRTENKGDPIFDVYGPSFVTKFLIYEDMKWVWVDAKEYEPYDRA